MSGATGPRRVAAALRAGLRALAAVGSIRGGRASRAARWVAVLLVPVLLLAMPQVANAATTYGTPSPVSVQLMTGGGGFSCNLNGQWVVNAGSGSVTVRGICDQGWASETNRADITRVTLLGTGCSGSADMGGDDPEVAWSGSVAFVSDPCVITTGIVSWCNRSWLGTDDCHTTQFDWVIEPPQEDTPDAGCTFGEVSKPAVSARYPTGSSLRQWRRDVSFNWKTQELGPGRWVFYVVTNRFPSGVSSGPLTNVQLEGDGAVTIPAAMPLTLTGLRTSENIAGGPPSVENWPIIGAGYYRTNSTAGWKLLGGNNEGILGVHDPARCAFYWGEPIATMPDDTDQPAGPLNIDQPPVDPQEPIGDPEPPASEAGCTFSITDPTTWASAGICAVVEVLLEVWNTLKSILSGITGLVGALLDGIRDLFIPDDWPSWSDLPSPLPQGWVPELPNLGGSGCGPLTFPEVSLGFNDWKVGPVTYADTCDDPWPLVRTLTYNGLLAMVLGSAVWLAFRSVTAGLGMNTTPSGGSDDE